MEGPPSDVLSSLMITYDGMTIPPFPGILKDGPEKRFQAIRDLETNEDDIILATHSRSGSIFWGNNNNNTLFKEGNTFSI